LLYFLAGLLPDPDGPWTPTVPHSHAWGIGILIEAVIAAVFWSQHRVIDAPLGLLDSLVGLGFARILLFLVMISLVALRENKLKKAEQGTASERRPLLENGDGPANGYGGTTAPPAKPEPKKRDPSKSNWFDYFAGTKVLFPYLWWVSQFIPSPMFQGYEVLTYFRPSNSPLHQATVLLCVVLLAAQRISELFTRSSFLFCSRGVF